MEERKTKKNLETTKKAYSNDYEEPEGSILGRVNLRERQISIFPK
jgi:hypothetical protein